MQAMALSWLVYRLTDSPFYLGLLAVARFGPSLLLSPLAGVVTDRLPRRNLVIGTQAASLVQAATLAALTLSGLATVWQLLALATFQGVIDTLDLPAARRSRSIWSASTTCRVRCRSTLRRSTARA
jgi:MFS family permease